MDKKVYGLGVMDLYPIAANKTQIENNPFLQAVLKEKVDADRLHHAVEEALTHFPLFGCTLAYKKNFFLEENNRSFFLINTPTSERPLEFGKSTNGFLWQICYDDYSFSLEWCHAVSDGRGGLDFFSEILKNYFGVPSEPLAEFPMDLGLESFYDKSQNGIPQKKQPKGFKAKSLPYLKRGYKTDCHILKAPMQQVLAAAKKNDASPAAVLPPLFSQILRKHLQSGAKNRNVSCNIVIDCRTPMKFETMHNCILSKVITYVDRYDTMDFALVSTIYRAILDLAVQQENIIRQSTDFIDEVKPLVSIRPLWLQKAAAKIVATALKHTDSNFTFTYLGRIKLPDEVMNNLADFNMRSWTDFGECNIAAVDLNGTLILNICENYKDKNIIPEFIEDSRKFGIEFEKTDGFVFEQANLRL